MSKKVLIVESRYYEDIANLLLEATIEQLNFYNVKFEKMEVLGALEIPILIKKFFIYKLPHILDARNNASSKPLLLQLFSAISKYSVIFISSESKNFIFIGSFLRRIFVKSSIGIQPKSITERCPSKNG